MNKREGIADTGCLCATPGICLPGTLQPSSVLYQGSGGRGYDIDSVCRGTGTGQGGAYNSNGLVSGRPKDTARRPLPAKRRKCEKERGKERLKKRGKGREIEKP